MKKLGILVSLLAAFSCIGCGVVKRLCYEGFSRDSWQQPDRVIEALGLEPGDRVLLCSDGLTSPLTNAAIAGLLARTPMGRPEALCQTLVDAANAAGGPDNITVIVVEVT